MVAGAATDAGQSFKVISCAGLADSDWCDVQFYVRGQPQMRSKSTRRQITAAIPLCPPQSPRAGPGRGRAMVSPGPQTRLGNASRSMGCRSMRGASWFGRLYLSIEIAGLRSPAIIARRSKEKADKSVTG